MRSLDKCKALPHHWCHLPGCYSSWVQVKDDQKTCCECKTGYCRWWISDCDSKIYWWTRYSSSPSRWKIVEGLSEQCEDPAAIRSEYNDLTSMITINLMQLLRQPSLVRLLCIGLANRNTTLEPSKALLMVIPQSPLSITTTVIKKSFILTQKRGCVPQTLFYLLTWLSSAETKAELSLILRLLLA